MHKVLTFLVAAVVASSLGVVGCDSVDAAFDCHAVCSRYKDCYDSSYDVAACRDRCRANADADEAKRRRADVCEACIDGQSCTAAAFTCTTECAGIVAGT